MIASLDDKDIVQIQSLLLMQEELVQITKLKYIELLEHKKQLVMAEIARTCK